MLKFVEKWLSERRDNAEIEKDGTVDKWTKCEDGLPSSDRKVEVLVYSPSRNSVFDESTPRGMNVCFAQFNPHVGWKMDRAGVVVSWRDMDKQYRDMINNLDWAKSSLSHLV